MIETRTLGKLSWVDMASPTADEIHEIMDTYHLHPLVADELRLPTLKPHVEQFGDLLFLILHFPVLKHSHTEKNQEVDFVLGKNFLITARYDTVDPLHKFGKEFDVEALLASSREGPPHAGHLFFYLLKKLYRAVGHELAYLADEIQLIEDNIFEGNEQAMVIELSNMSRHLLDFKQALAPHREILESFKEVSLTLYGHEFAPYS